MSMAEDVLIIRFFGQTEIGIISFLVLFFLFLLLIVCIYGEVFIIVFHAI